MYLLDTDVLGEVRRGSEANAGVRDFFTGAAAVAAPLYLSVITVREMSEEIEILCRRGDVIAASDLERWLERITTAYAGAILGFDERVAHLARRLDAVHPEKTRDNHMAATALVNDVILVTRHPERYESLGVRLLDPFS